MKTNRYYNPPFVTKVLMLFILLGLYKANSSKQLWQQTARVKQGLKNETAMPITASIKTKTSSDVENKD
jgi:hypothetical protein